MKMIYFYFRNISKFINYLMNKVIFDKRYYDNTQSEIILNRTEIIRILNILNCLF